MADRFKVGDRVRKGDRVGTVTWVRRSKSRVTVLTVAVDGKSLDLWESSMVTAEGDSRPLATTTATARDGDPSGRTVREDAG